MTGAAAGITKITKVENVGIFSSFTWPVPTTGQNHLSFSRINLAYGYNGSGKTTLSNIMGLFSSEPIDDLEFKRITQGLSTDPTKDIAVEIEWDGKLAKFPADKKKIYVFNAAFVVNHVYDGTRAKLKSFKNVVTKEQLSNPALKKIVEIIDAETEKKKSIEGYNEKLETLSTKIKKALSTLWNGNIEGSRMPQGLDLENCPAQAPQESAADLQKALEDQFSKFKISKDQAALEKDISDLGQIIDAHIYLPGGMDETLKKSISETAREKIKKKIEDLKQHALKHTTIQNWFEDGSNLLKLTRDTKICPLCDSQIPNIEEIISSYEAYFNDELTALLQELETAINAIENTLSESEKRQGQAVTIQNILSRYGYNDFLSEEEKSSFERISVQEIKEPLKKAKNVLEAKRNAIDFSPSEEDIGAIQALLSATTVFKTDIQLIIDTKTCILEKLQNARFNPNTAKDICKKLFWKRFDVQGKSIADDARGQNNIELPNNIGGIRFFHLLKELFQTTTQMITGKEREKVAELSKLKKESEYVNIFLSRMCISNFTINTENEGEITVNYSGLSPKRGIEYSLSEGEKTALAFAYFLSKYRHEVIDSQSEKQEDYTIVIDDPVSSLDENRLFSTALIIQEMLMPKTISTGSDENKIYTWSGAGQIFILSHNLIFLKFMGNIIDSDQNSGRTDFYIEKGKISLLPDILRNYQTSYFYKLSKIQAFAAGEVSYETVKDYLPNYIRVSLEAFISFKFARLRDRRNKHTPAMLESLIRHLDAHNFTNYAAVSAIVDGATLKAYLQEIKNKVNPECHGTVQDIVHIEYLSESELKKLAEQTLHVIQYLDQIHFKAAQNLKQAA